MTKIVVFAYSLVGHSCLKALIKAGENVVGVFTHPDSPTEAQWFPSVADLARTHHIPVIETESPKDPGVLEAMQTLQPELIFSFYYRKMIPVALLDFARLGSFNMHGSLLPRYRGRVPINWALVNGEKETGPTLHHMVKSADAGAIVDQEVFAITPTDTAFDLTHKMADAAVRVLLRQLPALKEGRAPSLVQDESLATTCAGRSAKDSEIHWDQTPWQIHNLIRAVPYPYFPPAFTHLRGEKIEVRANRVPNDNGLGEITKPGQVVDKGDGWIRVACGKGDVYLEVTALSCPLSDVKIGDKFD